MPSRLGCITFLKSMKSIPELWLIFTHQTCDKIVEYLSFIGTPSHDYKIKKEVITLKEEFTRLEQRNDELANKKVLKLEEENDIMMAMLQQAQNPDMHFVYALCIKLKEERIKTVMDEIKRESGCCDIYILSSEKHGYPDLPLLVCDLNLLDKEKATNETHVYASTVDEVCFPPNRTFLGLVGIPGNYSLYLYRSCDKHMHHIHVGRFEGDSLKKMFLVIHFGITELLTMSPVTTTKNECAIWCCEGNMNTLNRWGCDRRLYTAR